MNIFVIIITYNGINDIDRCLKSIAVSTIPLHTIVIDNASTDMTVSFIKKNYPNIHVIESVENLGFGKANNIGLKYAMEHNCDYVYLLNQDAWLLPDTIETLVTVQKNNPEYGVISPLQITASQQNLDKNFSACCAECPHILDDLLLNNLKEIYPVPFTMAAHWLITRFCLQKVGFFNPIFPHYGEDDNYENRLSYFNIPNGICPIAKAVHNRSDRKRTRQQEIYKYYISLLKNSLNISITRNKRIKRTIKLVYINIRNAVFFRSISPIVNIIRFFIKLPDIIRTNKLQKKEGAFIQ
ncbi:MAG: glycosyltransferase [Treponema sp.]